MNASYNESIIDLMARNEADMERVEMVAAYMVRELGYEEIAGDEDTIVLGHGGTIADAKKDYKDAKKAAL